MSDDGELSDSDDGQVDVNGVCRSSVPSCAAESSPPADGDHQEVTEAAPKLADGQSKSRRVYITFTEEEKSKIQAEQQQKRRRTVATSSSTTAMSAQSKHGGSHQSPTKAESVLSADQDDQRQQKSIKGKSSDSYDDNDPKKSDTTDEAHLQEPSKHRSHSSESNPFNDDGGATLSPDNKSATRNTESVSQGDCEVITKDELSGASNPDSNLCSAHTSTNSEADSLEKPVSEEEELPTYCPALTGCRSVEEFHCLNRIEEGTYGVVYRATEKRTGRVVALKRLKMEKEKEGFPITSLREVNMLLKAGYHPNIVNVQEIVVGSNMDKIYLVMEYIEHDMKSLMECMKQPFLVGEVKTLMKQLLNGVFHLHDNWILHRDLKSSNLLLSHDGILKIGDFGLSREYGSPLRPYTPVVVTLWYRAPELLLGCREYSTAIDLWSVGCLFSEFLTLKPLFPAKSEIDELNKIFKVLGTPNEKIWPGYSDLPNAKKVSFAEQPHNMLRKMFGATLSDRGYNLLTRLLTYDPKQRITAAEGLKHDWFVEEPRPVHPSQFPSWPAKSEMHSGSTASRDPKPPSGGQAYKEVAEADKDLLASLKIRPHQSRSAGFMLKFDAVKF